ncbi:MAG: PIN domain-containing protein [bacterium]
MENKPIRYVLDTSALLALREDEAGADEVERILREAEKGECEVYLSFMTLMELCYRLWQDKGEQSAKEILAETKALPVQEIREENDLLIKASRVKASFSLSVADSWIIATAWQKKAKLVHKDPEFEQVKEIVELLPLPYKNAG